MHIEAVRKVFAECPSCAVRCRVVPRKHGGVMLLEVDEYDLFIRIHSILQCHEGLLEPLKPGATLSNLR